MKEAGFIKIPNRLQIGGTIFDIEFVERTGNTNMGRTDYSATQITIAKNVDMSPASKSSMQGTFFHEVVHAMLEELGEYNLSGDERFVQSLSTMINQITQQIVKENVEM